jgi:hypothetical protein
VGQVETDVRECPVHLFEDRLALRSLEDRRDHDLTPSVTFNFGRTAALKIPVPRRGPMGAAVGGADVRDPVHFHVGD